MSDKVSYTSENIDGVNRFRHFTRLFVTKEGKIESKLKDPWRMIHYFKSLSQWSQRVSILFKVNLNRISQNRDGSVYFHGQQQSFKQSAVTVVWKTNCRNISIT